ncbi:hypothetical protein AYO20_01542 [Fonsecaea nubica]|uniref:Uncharacterized protein n=1 Tax=Fonsecaea nubica TaxID=856822 RepID=A0A178DD11_9EURO|nr:hypothetical protein AYO20_01542 [Fonsecaea nubica]OAL39224.1 hypothetical protein AYO20_01542 [Fonsecaea nubica]
MLMPRKHIRRGGDTTSDTNDGVRHRRGRPMKRVDQLKPSRTARTIRANLIHEQLTAEVEPRKKVSALESLPVEIIEQIFFHCLELDLPRASVHLARALSRPSVYSVLVLFAFFEADETSHVETRHFSPATFRLIGFDEQRRLQEAILVTRWCTPEFLQSCIPALNRLAMVRHWHRERELLTAARSAGILWTRGGQSAQLADPDILLPAIDDEIGMQDYFSFGLAIPDIKWLGAVTYDSINTSPSLFIKTTYLSDHPVRSQPQPKEVWLERLMKSVLAVHTIPEHLVRRKTWTYRDIGLLRLLLSALGTRDSSLPDNKDWGPIRRGPSPQATFEGMANAVREGNRMALEVLIDVYNSIVKHEYPDQPLPLRLFHLVCERAQDPAKGTGLQGSIISLLLDNAAEQVPADDEILTHWAIHVTNSAATTKHHHITVATATRLLQHMENQGHPSNHHAIGARDGDR